MSKKVMRLTWPELVMKAFPEQEFWIDPYIPRGGITFLYASWGVGKTSLTWAMSRSIATGQQFMGLPAHKGNVLYIELDSPEALVASRLRDKEEKPEELEGVRFFFCPPLGLPTPDPEVLLELQKEEEQYQPDVVFINTLRKAHTLDDKDSRASVVLYSWFQNLFGKDTSLVFVHHTKKQPSDPNFLVDDSEAFSGTKAFINDCQCALYLQPFTDTRSGANLRLWHIKGQGTARYKPLLLQDGRDGYTLRCPKKEQLDLALKIIEDKRSRMSLGQLDLEIARALSVSGATGRRLRETIVNGYYPASREWLGRVGGADEDE